MARCTHCEGEPGSAYSLWQPDDAFMENFEVAAELRFGERVRCRHCASRWYRWSTGGTCSLTFVTDEIDAVITRWSEVALVPSAEQRAILGAIGGINGDAYGNDADFIDVPCVATPRDGVATDFSVVRFSRIPPLTRPAAWITDIATLAPSRYALPVEVRYEASRAQEIANSYAPTLARTPDGGLVVLNWSPRFFASTRVAGSELRHIPRAEQDRIGYFSRAESEIGEIQDTGGGLVVWADWDDSIVFTPSVA